MTSNRQNSAPAGAFAPVDRRRATLAKLVGATCMLAILAGCGLPRSGPSKSEIFAGSVQEDGDAFIVLVNDRVTRATAVTPAFGFSESFINQRDVVSDTIRPGDVLGLTIWENVSDGLLAAEGANQTPLEQVQVDGSGFIFVPYAGRLRAAGNTPDAIRRVITERLEQQTPDPQVEVRRLAGDGATVTIAGPAAGSQGNFPIERPTTRLSSMLAQAGGVSIAPEIAQVTVVRGDQRGTVWFEDIYNNPDFDIALRAGDRILVEGDVRTFTALGATGSQSVVPFERQNISALEAIARVGGLNSGLADPTGVFVFRNEPEEIAQIVMGRTDLTGTQRVAYVLDLTEANGLFTARDFVIRDGDTLYVTEAPFVTWNKTISALTGSLGSIGGLQSAATGLGG